MTNNLIICCSFTDVESEQGIRYALGVLGEAVQVMPSVWYATSSYDAGDAAEMIRSVTDATASLLVVNASQDDHLAWFNLAEGDRVQRLWDKVAGRPGPVA